MQVWSIPRLKVQYEYDDLYRFERVNAADPEQYLRKAIEFRRTAKKGVKPIPVSGATPGVKRYSKNGRYIDLTPDDRIVSFGSTADWDNYYL